MDYGFLITSHYCYQMLLLYKKKMQYPGVYYKYRTDHFKASSVFTQVTQFYSYHSFIIFSHDMIETFCEQGKV